MEVEAAYSPELRVATVRIASAESADLHPPFVVRAVFRLLSLHRAVVGMRSDAGLIVAEFECLLP